MVAAVALARPRPHGDGMSEIIVGVDLSPASEHAAQHAAALAARGGHTLLIALATSAPDLAAPVDHAMWPAFEVYADRARRLLERDRGELAALAARLAGTGVPIETLVVDGQADDVLPELAQQRKATMLVVGSHGRTGLRRAVLGSVAERVVRHAHVPVYVARGPVTAGGPRRVLVGTDFGSTAGAALSAGATYVAPGGELELVACWRLVPLPADVETGVFDSGQLRADVEADLQARADQALATVARTDVTKRFTIVDMDPTWGLVDRAGQAGADLVVVGSHGRRGLRRWLLGSVAETTVRHAPCSVLVAR
jgi:nucleotide-binding universal stress UspA family protein